MGRIPVNISHSQFGLAVAYANRTPFESKDIQILGMPTAIDILIIAFFFAALVSPYLLYPLLVRYVFRPKVRTPVQKTEALPKVSVLIPAHNEAARLKPEAAKHARSGVPARAHRDPGRVGRFR